MGQRRSKVASVAFTGAAATITAGMVAAQAQAASSWHIKNNTTGYHGAVKLRNNGTITFKDGTAGEQFTCGRDVTTGSVPASNVPIGASPTVMKLPQWSLTRCSLFANAPLTMRAAKSLAFHAETYSPSTGITKGYLGTKGAASAVSIAVTGVGNNCMATLTGSTLPASYKNPSRNLIADAAKTFTMKVAHATSCALLHTGNKLYISGKFSVYSPSKLAIAKS